MNKDPIIAGAIFRVNEHHVNSIYQILDLDKAIQPPVEPYFAGSCHHRGVDYVALRSDKIILYWAIPRISYLDVLPDYDNVNALAFFADLSVDLKSWDLKSDVWINSSLKIDAPHYLDGIVINKTATRGLTYGVPGNVVKFNFTMHDDNWLKGTSLGYAFDCQDCFQNIKIYNRL